MPDKSTFDVNFDMTDFSQIMQTMKNKFTTLVFLAVCGTFLLNGCGSIQSAKISRKRLKKDPEDFSANNKLAGFYLQKLRETSDVQFLDLAFRRARASLESVPDERNSGGLPVANGASGLAAY